MDLGRSKLISTLLGSVSISELPLSPLSKKPSENNWYIAYYNANPDMRKISELDLYNYLVARIFFIMAEKNGDIYDLSGIDNILNSLSKKTPVILGRWLNDNRINWIEKTEGNVRTTLSDVFLPEFQYAYLENKGNRKPTMLLRYSRWCMSQDEMGSNYTGAVVLCPCQWDTHIQPPSGNAWNWNESTHRLAIYPFRSLWKSTNPQKPITFSGLTMPSSAMVKNNGVTDFSRYENRNYNQIVNGNGKDECGIDNDEIWGGVRQSNENEKIEKDKQGQDVINRIGDIDATLNAIMEYLDDWNEGNDFRKRTFAGMVVITTNQASLTDFSQDDTFKYDDEERKIKHRENPTENEEFYWNESIFDGRFIRAKSGVSATGGEDTVKFTESQIPRHSHNTISVNGDDTIHNISVMGNPEGEAIGGVVVSDRLQKSKSGTENGPIDSEQTLPSNVTYGINEVKGPYTGGLKYDIKINGTNSELPDQIGHANLPLFYNVRILLRLGKPNQ